MGRKTLRLKALFGIGKKSSKLSTFLQHAVNRTALLKNRQQALFSFCHSDIVELLKLGYEEHAFLRVEHLMKSKNMLDTLDMVEFYCHVLTRELPLIERRQLVCFMECSEDVREAISSLIFASTRMGEFPELRNICEFFTSKFGKEYTSQVNEFPRYLGVNDKIMEKLSKRKQSLESRVGFVREIASKNGITLYLNADVQERETPKQVINRARPLPSAYLSKSSAERNHYPTPT